MMKETEISKQDLERIFQKNGFEDFRWIDPRKIAVAFWVRMKCIYGCPNFGKNAACPPHTPSISDCERFFQEYSEGVIFHFERKEEVPGDRHVWSKEINLRLLELEKSIFLAGHVKVFLLFMDTCEICESCTKKRERCDHPKLARPTPEAMGIDVFTTVRQVGYPIDVLKDTTETMNRYAFLMIE